MLAILRCLGKVLVEYTTVSAVLEQRKFPKKVSDKFEDIRYVCQPTQFTVIQVFVT